MRPQLPLDDRQFNTQLFELRELMVLCVAWADALPLDEVSPHLDLAVASLDQCFARRATLVGSPEMVQ